MALVKTSTRARCSASASSTAGVEPAQPPREGVPRRGQAGPFARQLQAQGRHRIGEPLGGQRGDVVGAAGTRQQLHGPPAHSFRDGVRGQGQPLFGGRPGGGLGQFGHALVDGPVRLLDEAVAVQQDQLARGERAGRQHRRRAGAQRPGPGALEVPGRSVDADDQRRGMTAGGVAQLPVGRVEHRQGERGRPQGGRAGGERVGALQDTLESGLRGQQLGQHGAQLAHRRRGGDPVSHHVTDDQRDAAVGQRDRVEPVAAGRLLLPGHQVPGRDPGPRQDRQGGGQQRFLHFRHDPPGGQRPALRVGRLLLGHAVGDVGGDDQEPVDRAVGGPPRRHREVGVDLLQAARTCWVFWSRSDPRPPFRPRLRLSGRVHPVEHFVQRLGDELGEGVPVRHAQHVGPAGEGPERRVHRGQAMIRAVQGGHQDRQLLEGVPHQPGLAHHATQRVVIVRATRQHGLLLPPVRENYPGDASQTGPLVAIPDRAHGPAGPPKLTKPADAHKSGRGALRTLLRGQRGPVRRSTRKGTVVSTSDKAKNKVQETKGKAKETAGRAVGNERLEAEGVADQTKADVKQAGEKVKDAGKSLKP